MQLYREELLPNGLSIFFREIPNTYTTIEHQKVLVFIEHPYKAVDENSVQARYYNG